MNASSRPNAAGVLLALLLSVCASQARSTVVQFETVLGDFQILLYEETTPQTVANFLDYVESGAYTNTFIHRAVNNFIVQGGGYNFDYDTEKLVEIPLLPPIINEPGHSNLRGTLAMAKLPGQPHSAQAQWFFNLVDNSFLDDVDGGFTVFGEVLDDGMAIIDEIMNISRFTHTVDGFTFNDWPLRNYTRANRNADAPVGEQQLVLIHRITVLSGIDEEEPPIEVDEPAEPPMTEPEEEPENNETTEEFAPEPEEQGPGDQEPEPVTEPEEMEEAPEETAGNQQPTPNNPPSTQSASSGGGTFNVFLVLLLTLAITLNRRWRH